MQARVQIPRFRVLLGINPSGKNERQDKRQKYKDKREERYIVKESPGKGSFSFSIVAGYWVLVGLDSTSVGA